MSFEKLRSVIHKVCEMSVSPYNKMLFSLFFIQISIVESCMQSGQMVSNHDNFNLQQEQDLETSDENWKEWNRVSYLPIGSDLLMERGF